MATAGPACDWAEETLEHVLTCPSAGGDGGAHRCGSTHRSDGLTDMIRETVTDAKKAAQVVRKLTTAIGEQAHKTWAARCQAYAEWEKACGITKVMKERRAKAKRTEARGREADAPPDDTAGNARRKRADPEPGSGNAAGNDYGWVRASAAMQVYDHTNRYAWGVGTQRARPR
eukprot:tig00020614_g12244.t1